MKNLSLFLFLWLAATLGGLSQNLPVVMVDNTGTVVAPALTNFVHKNVLTQKGITRQVDGIANIAGAAAFRTGEHVLVIDAGTFGNGGPVLFFHDSGSSDPTNTTDTLAAATGRWVAKRVFGSIPSFAEITGKPNSLAGYGITNEITFGGTVSNLVALGTTTFDTLEVTNFITTTSKLGASSGSTLDITNSIRQRNVTGSRNALYDANGFLTNDVADTGTGAPVRAASPALSGTPTAPTQSPGDNSTKIATTAYTDAAVTAGIVGAGGGFKVNGSGAVTNVVSSNNIAFFAGPSGTAYGSNVFPQIVLFTNALVTNWTVPTGAKKLTVTMIGAGGGGGSGRRGLTNTIVGGGAGGGPGGWVHYTFPIAAITNSTITITNGGGGTGGLAQTSTSSNGNPGGNGTLSSFGNYLWCSGGGGGGGGISGAATAGAAASTYTMIFTVAGGAPSATGLAPSSAPDANTTSPYFEAQFPPSGGGAGGGIATTGVASGGARGGVATQWAPWTKYGAGGGVGINGTPGSSGHSQFFIGGGGGGGGGSSLTANGGNGGNGGNYGSGGGGGGAGADTGGNSGAGGNGADGAIMIVVE